MTGRPLRLVFLGLSLSSSWGNGHATTYRALLTALAAQGHDLLFLERDQPWYAANRDLVDPDFCRLELYPDLKALRAFRSDIAGADAVVVGSYVTDGVEVARWVQEEAGGVTAFYDIDTPVTLAKLARGDHEYLDPALIPGFDLYFSFTGGPTLERLEREYGAPAARALYCAVDPALYKPQPRPARWDLSYVGTYAPDRQPAVERLLLEPARRLPHLRFCVAGPAYPGDIAWPANVERIDHVAARDLPDFYAASRFTLNATRGDMVRAGYSPSVRLFEAAACGTPIVSDRWAGIETVFTPGEEILLADDGDAIVAILAGWDEKRRRALGRAGRRRVMRQHTAAHRARDLCEQVARAATRPLQPAAVALRKERSFSTAS
jgi:spore maturation protein CgeB